MDLKLRGKRALVTGASKGIGAAVAEVLAEEGCELHLVARGASALEDLAGRLHGKYGVEAHAQPADLRDPRMKERGHGVIVNNIGAAGERPDFDYIAGSSGTAALMAFTRALGGRSLRDGIRVVAVNPGPVETERILALLKAQAHSRFGDESRYTELTARFPLGRAATPREVADLIVFLASERSAYTRGAVFTLDGGLSAS